MPDYDHAAQRRFAVEVLAKLREAGYVAYWAGGCVRDELLGRVPKDYDVATSARPEEIRNLFGHRRTLAIGEAFGVIAVIGPKEAGMVEATTFRRDGNYADGRRPDAVEFTDAEEDARRRDFTMNALFFDPLENRVIDYVGGQADIERRLVRAVGDARARFGEDKLRMLRAVRMASRFGFDIDPATSDALRAAAHEITLVSPERIAQEMRAMLGKPGQAEAARLLMRTGLVEAVLPELTPTNSPTWTKAWNATLSVLEELERQDDKPFGVSFALGLATLLHAAGHANIVGKIANRWRLSNVERDDAGWFVENQYRLIDASRQPWSLIQPILADPRASELVMLLKAKSRVTGRTDDVEFCRRKLSLSSIELDPPPLATGYDLIAAGLKPGKNFARVIGAIRAAQLDSEISSRDEAVTMASKLFGGEDFSNFDLARSISDGFEDPVRLFPLIRMLGVNGRQKTVRWVERSLHRMVDLAHISFTSGTIHELIAEASSAAGKAELNEVFALLDRASLFGDPASEAIAMLYIAHWQAIHRSDNQFVVSLVGVFGRMSTFWSKEQSAEIVRLAAEEFDGVMGRAPKGRIDS